MTTHEEKIDFVIKSCLQMPYINQYEVRKIGYWMMISNCQ